MFIDFAQHPVAYAFWLGNQDFPQFVAFVDEIMAPKDDFVGVVKACAQLIAWEVRPR